MHFNAVNPKDQSLKLAACWPSSAGADFNNYLNRMAGMDVPRTLSHWTEGTFHDLTPSEFRSK
jgi:hypothetical protein